MELLEEVIRKYAFIRLTKIFHIPENSLSLSDRFGEELKSTYISDFKSNEFDFVLDDIKDVATKDILKMIKDGTYEIRTVEDYCNHMIICASKKTEEVIRILDISEKN